MSSNPGEGAGRRVEFSTVDDGASETSGEETDEDTRQGARAASSAGYTPPPGAANFRREGDQYDSGFTTGPSTSRADLLLAAEMKSLREQREPKISFKQLPDNYGEYPVWRTKAFSNILSSGMP